MGDNAKTNTNETHNLRGDELLEKAKRQTEEVFKAHNVDKTPFAIIEKDNTFTVVLGRYKLHEGHFKTIEEAQEEAMREDWERIMQVCGIMIANSDEINELKNEIKEIKKLWEKK